jgi:hypothetical protein
MCPTQRIKCEWVAGANETDSPPFLGAQYPLDLNSRKPSTNLSYFVRCA